MPKARVETIFNPRSVVLVGASDTPGTLGDILRRTLNRARQAQITQELSEIVGGAEALQG